MPDNTSTPINVVRLFIQGMPFNVLVRLKMLVKMLVYVTIYIFSHSNISVYKISQIWTSSLLVL